MFFEVFSSGTFYKRKGLFYNNISLAVKELLSSCIPIEVPLNYMPVYKRSNPQIFPIRRADNDTLSTS